MYIRFFSLNKCTDLFEIFTACCSALVSLDLCISSADQINDLGWHLTVTG